MCVRGIGCCQLPVMHELWLSSYEAARELPLVLIIRLLNAGHINEINIYRPNQIPGERDIDPNA